ncbi:MAG TPA: hypothetical protein VE152_11950, partial [Acidimicrobiales bacterium]|nr:hypothetical protein [Acidimicrobiales bacterium]
PTTVFETARFGRSRIPPPMRLAPDRIMSAGAGVAHPAWGHAWNTGVGSLDRGKEDATGAAKEDWVAPRAWWLR